MNDSVDELSRADADADADADAGAGAGAGAGAAAGVMSRLARWSVRHRRTVIIAWVALTVAGAVAAGRTGDRLSFTFDLPGQPAFETNSDIVRTFGSGGNNPPLVVVAQLPPGTTVDTPGIRAELGRVFDAARAAVPGARIASWIDADNRGFVSADGRTTFGLVYPVPSFASNDPYVSALPALRHGLSSLRVGGSPVLVTGATILASGGSSGRSVLVETLVAGVAALVILTFVFGSLVALLPMLIAAVAIPTAFVFIYALTYVTTMSTLVQNIVALIGLGVAIDYALLVVTRWREERAGGRDNRAAVIVAATTAGQSVLFSGITVAVSLAALALTSVPVLRSIGLAGLLIPLVSVAVTGTLLPVVLDGIGRRLEWPRRRPVGTVSRLWTRIAETVVRHPVVATLAAVVALGVTIAPVFALSLGPPQAVAAATTAPVEARSGLDALTSSGIGAGVLRPTEIILPAGASLPPAPAGLTQVAPPAWTRAGQQVADAWPAAESSTASGRDALAAIRTSVNMVPGARIGGAPAEDADFIHALYGKNLVVIVCAIVVVTTLLLARALRSVWLPVKALLLNVVSLAAAFGVLTYIWQEGHATQVLFGSPATGAITLWVPLAVFALLFGLSMDYEVFILSRINEEYARGHPLDRAVVRGIGHTGRLVTSGALILFLAFVALGGVPQTDVKVLSTGLAAGILIDATIIRGVLAPALVALFGRANWWLPGPIARLLRITRIRQTPSEPRQLAGHHAER